MGVPLFLQSGQFRYRYLAHTNFLPTRVLQIAQLYSTTKICSLHDDTMVKKVWDESVRQISFKDSKVNWFAPQPLLLQQIAR
jgi:hypothetical protein